MSIHPKPGQKADVAGTAGLRRRVIFQLDPEQLPLLEAVRDRHGSTRAGLIAALEAEAEAEALRERAESAERRLEQSKKTTEKRKGPKTDSKRYKAALAKAAKRESTLEADLKDAREKHAETQERSRQAEEDYEETLEEFGEEIDALRERAVDWLYCARCGQWIDQEDWVWRRIEGGGSYAYHCDCGDRKAGLLPASWLARRS